MRRRDFLQTVIGVSASIMLPTMRWRIGYDLHRIAATFCAKQPYGLFDLTEPYVMDGHAYATDARTMCRFAADGDDTDPVRHRIPTQTLDVWDRFWSERGKWIKPPRERLITVDQDQFCPRCFENLPDCTACAGTGERVFGDNVYGREWVGDCPECRGHGVRIDPSCPECRGLYFGNMPSVQVVGDKLIAGGYYRRLMRVPGIMLNLGSADPREPILWKSDIGLCGLQMPLDPSVVRPI